MIEEILDREADIASIRNMGNELITKADTLEACIVGIVDNGDLSIYTFGPLHSAIGMTELIKEKCISEYEDLCL